MKPRRAAGMVDTRAHQPRKRFGQNFLRDPQVIQRIIDAVDPAPGQRMLEIGPGQGALTRPLAASGITLDCVEVDRDLAADLIAEFSGQAGITIHNQDILKFDLSALGAPARGLRIVGNLPYNISTPVLFHLLRQAELIQDMIFMLQLEVVQRMNARVGEKNYGRLGLMLQYFCRVEHLFNVPSAAFSPKPRVVSSIVRLTPHASLPTPARDVDVLRDVIRTAFNQRRKTLKNSLKGIISEDRLNQLPIDLGLRPENLSLADYVLISDAIATGGENDDA